MWQWAWSTSAAPPPRPSLEVSSWYSWPTLEWAPPCSGWTYQVKWMGWTQWWLESLHFNCPVLQLCWIWSKVNFEKWSCKPQLSFTHFPVLQINNQQNLMWRGPQRCPRQCFPGSHEESECHPSLRQIVGPQCMPGGTETGGFRGACWLISLVELMNCWLSERLFKNK